MRSMKDKLVKLQKLYIDQFQRILHKMRLVLYLYTSYTDQFQRILHKMRLVLYLYALYIDAMRIDKKYINIELIYGRKQQKT